MSRQRLTTALLLVSGLFFYVPAFTQELYSAHARWDDSFREWDIETVYEQLDGELSLQWMLKEDWTEWQVRLGDFAGTIRRKWDNNPNAWELRSGSEIVFMRTVFPGDLSRWRVQYKDLQLVFRTRYGNVADDWLLERGANGDFFMYTEFEGDPRDWIIEDGIADEVPLPARLALCFLTIYHSSPNR